MGQQQLLLIVLGVIIVGVAIVVGINLFNANSEQAAKDTMVSESTNIGALAQQYYKKPQAMGGGGGDFTSFSIPADLKSPQGGYGTYAGSGNATGFTITGTPKDYSGKWSVTTTVTPTQITSKVQ
jgi:hypothetical protein